MWIKTISGALLNAELAETIVYDEEDNYTKATIADRECVIAEGDIVPLITSAIIKNMNYVGVR